MVGCLLWVAWKRGVPVGFWISYHTQTTPACNTCTKMIHSEKEALRYQLPSEFKEFPFDTVGALYASPYARESLDDNMIMSFKHKNECRKRTNGANNVGMLHWLVGYLIVISTLFSSFDPQVRTLIRRICKARQLSYLISATLTGLDGVGE